MTDQKSYPVKYMPVCSNNPYEEPWCEIIDTTIDGRGLPVCLTWSMESAHRIAKLLNESEGYEYRPEP